MKLHYKIRTLHNNTVAPPAGAWIETVGGFARCSSSQVSPPPRGRGLKHRSKTPMTRNDRVAPPAGAWIETPVELQLWFEDTRRPPRGGVD